MFPYRWTADGKYLYLYPRYYPGLDGLPDTYFLLDYLNNFYRINLETGAFELILRSDQYDALELSPNDQYLAYSEQISPDIIHIKNMESGDDLQVKLNEDVIASGAFIWNSESTKVVFTLGYGTRHNGWLDNLSGTSIYVLTPKNMHAQKVLSKDPRIFTPYACSLDAHWLDKNAYWLDKNTMCLYTINSDLDSWNKIFTFNIETGVVVFLRAFP